MRRFSASCSRGGANPSSWEGLFPIGSDPRAQLYADVPAEVADLAISRLVDQRLQPFADRVTRAAWHTIPSTYIVTEQDASLSPEMQEQMAARTNNIRRIPTSHSPFLSRPAELAALLDEIAKDWPKAAPCGQRGIRASCRCRGGVMPPRS